MVNSALSKHQVSSLSIKNQFNTVWTVEHPNPNQRFEMIGEQVTANEGIILKHSSTNQFLSSDDLPLK
jgi:hypothetical protein